MKAGRGSPPLLARIVRGVRRIARPQHEDEAEEFDPPLGEEAADLAEIGQRDGIDSPHSHVLDGGDDDHDQDRHPHS